MSGYTRNSVYNHVASAIASEHANAFCTSRYVPKPPSFPACYIHEIDNFRTLNALQLDFEDVQCESVFEIQVISDLKGTAASEAYSIMETAKAAFNELYYRQFSETTYDTVETFMVVCRFRRVIGGGDILPQNS